MMLKRVYAMNAGLVPLVNPNEEKRPLALRTAANSAKLNSICACTTTRFLSVWPSCQCPARTAVRKRQPAGMQLMSAESATLSGPSCGSPGPCPMQVHARKAGMA